ncbi:P-loop containing nucleoside triphosphate hydrolase protein [Microdochium trichocladiopsis]|uniref:P-loop containing nucleoside triphosphate hydrolase protein n=1 Tax=Microdochium trichocladiopsis TaxID=1682393 RepID=A0A9P8Y4J3_9PEZI|nr:P-loop containing nucleoside triphosphate hydrolase protein [Microdochium trichocladiopsis]KAH7027485.1 P-loop containing nucleoside triphosphate hydrolase protein [Microdochium trichocladiopsis]
MEKGQDALASAPAGPTAAASTAPVASGSTPFPEKAATTTTTAKSSANPPLLTKEEAAAQDAKLRPEREAAFADYLRIFSYAKPWDFPLMIVAALAAMGAGTTLPLMNVVFGALVGQFTSYFTPNPTITQEEFQAGLNRQSLYIFLLFLGRFVLTYINKFSFRMIGIRMSAAIRLHYLQCLFSQAIHVLDSMAPGSAAGTITTTANTMQLGISEKLGTFLEFMATIITATVIAFTYSWSLTLVTCSIIVFIGIVSAILIPFIVKSTSRTTKAETKSSSVASEAFSAIRMVTACGAEAQMTKRFAVWADAARRHGLSTSPLMAAQFGLIFFSLYAAFALAFWFGGHNIGNSETVLVVLMSVMMMVISLERISTPLIAVGKAMVAACEFFTIIDAPRPESGNLKGPEVTANNDITFKGVDFAYPSRPHVKVLDGLDLTIQAGKLTAIVGPSGSGKSTIVGLIERWYTLQNQHVIAKAIDPEKKKKAAEKKKKQEKKAKKNGGVIETDSDDEEAASQPEDTGAPIELKGSIQNGEHELNAMDLKWWRSQIGLVQQEPFLFNDSIYKNVAYGLIGSEFENESEERKKELVREACRESFADEFIDRLPDGYETFVGDSGTKLSGGQRQRISIARAVIKKPKILILDEATSAIDVRGEKIVQAALDKVSQGRTTITIAHRLSTIRKADTIVVLKKGKVVEQGTHDSLLENDKGVYYGLVHAQHLSLGEPSDASDVETTEEEDLGTVLDREKSAALSEGGEVTGQGPGWKQRGLVRSFGLLLYEQKTRFPAYVITIVAAMCAGSVSPVQAYLFAKILDVFTLPIGSPEYNRDINFWSLMWAVLAISNGIAYFTLGYVSTTIAHHVSSFYRKQYFENLLYQKTSYFDHEDNSTGTLTARVGGDPKQLEELLGMNMSMVYTSFFTLVGSLSISFAFGWKLALVATCVTVPLGLIAGYFRFRFEIQFEKMYGAVFAESSKFAAEAIGAFRTVASLTLEDTVTGRYDALLSGHITEAYKKARWSTIIFAFSESVSLGCQALIFWYGGTLLASREYNMVQFLVCYMAVIQGAEAAGQGFSFGPNAAQASGAANRILSVRSSRHQGQIGETEHITGAEGGIKIELKNVHFKYPTRDVNVFKNLNMTIEKGQFAALVGASGCGKTSIISLLERFYEVPRGEILANGTDISKVDVHEYRKHLSLVAQEPTLFQGTLRENILLGMDPDAISEEELHAVCRDASIHDFIVSLPDGYNTEIGSKGVSLSGGQKQRVAIARALARKPHVLLLDEATSSLDSESEKLVQAAFERAAEGRTMVVVAHRLATVQNADVIFVLGEGNVLEKGSHAELLKKKGVYWHMCQSQALDR